jgi:hypothetical protein
MKMDFSLCGEFRQTIQNLHAFSAAVSGVYRVDPAEIGPFIDFSYFDLIDKERFTLSGEKREGDILIKTRLHGQDAAFLFHLENQGYVQAGLPDRILEYLALDRREFRLEVYPIVLVTCRWPGAKELSPLISDFPNKRVLYFDFEVVVLDEMLAFEYVGQNNPAALALSGGMQVDPRERARLAVTFLESLAAVELSPEERQIVMGFFFGHLRLEPEEKLQMKEDLSKVEGMQHFTEEEIMGLNIPFVDWALDRGERQGEASLVLRQLKHRFGDLKAEQATMIQSLPLEKLEELGESLLKFETPKDLEEWLTAS